MFTPETLTWDNVDGSHSYDLNDVTSPARDFDVTINQRTDTTRTKVQQPGVWGTRSYRGAMTIHVEGDIFHDSPAQYVTLRLGMVLALFGDPDAVVTHDKLGRLSFTLDGQGESWYADCTISTFSAPMTANMPSLTSYLISFESFLPYFIGTDSGNKYQWS